MKGQFFIISAVVIVAAIVLISQFLSDFNKYDVTEIEQMQEVKYVGMVQDMLVDSAKISYNTSGCESIGEDIKIAEDALKETLLFKGLFLEANHDVTACSSAGTVRIWFTLKNENIDAVSNFTLAL